MFNKFMIKCNTCGRHKDEGIIIVVDRDFDLEIHCPCGEVEYTRPDEKS